MGDKLSLKEIVEIKCRCRDCCYSSRVGNKLCCYFWDYETGMAPNEVEENGFCSNGTT